MIEFLNLTKKPVKRAVFVELYKKIFSTKKGQSKNNFELSLVFAPPAMMKKLNIQYRRKRKVANVLSFLLEKNSGEIFLNANEKNLPHLFAHGCLHLKGYDHENDDDAEKMEDAERKILNS